jgi:hypothetical protein
MDRKRTMCFFGSKRSSDNTEAVQGKVGDLVVDSEDKGGLTGLGSRAEAALGHGLCAQAVPTTDVSGEQQQQLPPPSGEQ